MVVVKGDERERERDEEEDESTIQQKVHKGHGAQGKIKSEWVMGMLGCWKKNTECVSRKADTKEDNNFLPDEMRWNENI